MTGVNRGYIQDIAELAPPLRRAKSTGQGSISGARVHLGPGYEYPCQGHTWGQSASGPRSTRVQVRPILNRRAEIGRDKPAIARYLGQNRRSVTESKNIGGHRARSGSYTWPLWEIVGIKTAPLLPQNLRETVESWSTNAHSTNQKISIVRGRGLPTDVNWLLRWPRQHTWSGTGRVIRALTEDYKGTKLGYE